MTNCLQITRIYMIIVERVTQLLCVSKIVLTYT